MPQVTRHDFSDQHLQVTITVTKEEYLPKVQSELKKLAKQVQLNGFRKGLAPESLIKAKYGTPALSDVVLDEVNDAMRKFMEETKLRLIGNPIPDQDSSPSINYKNMSDYSFTFDLGYVKDFDIVGLDETYEMPVLEPTTEQVEQELDRARRQQAEYDNDAPTVTENGFIKVALVELNDDGSVKEGGATTADSGFSVEYSMGEIMRNRVIGLNKGDSFEFEVAELEKETPEQFKTRVLNLEADAEAGNRYRATINSIMAQKLAEVNEAFIKTAFGPDAEGSTEEDAKKLLGQFLLQSNQFQGRTVLKNSLFANLIDKNRPELPTAFLLKMVKYNNPALSDEKAQKSVDSSYHFLVWSYMKQQIRERFNVEPNVKEFEDGIKESIRGYYGQYKFDGVEAIIQSTFTKMMKDEKYVDEQWEKYMEDITIDAIANNVKVKEVMMTDLEAYKALNQSYVEKANSFFQNEPANELLES